MSYPHTEAALDALFANADDVFKQLTAFGTRPFTFEQFRRELVWRNQRAYIALLQHNIRTQAPFGFAHASIGTRLKAYTTCRGYVRRKVSGGDVDIFGHETDKVIYEPPK